MIARSSASRRRRCSTTTSTCSRASRARCAARCRSRRPASVASGRPSTTSSGNASRTRLAAPRPQARWSTCSCSAASTHPEAVEQAVSGALAAGAIDGRAVQVLCRRTSEPAGRRASHARPAHRSGRRADTVDQRLRRAPRERIGASADGRPDRRARGADPRAHARAETAHDRAALQGPRRRGDTHPADPDGVPRGAARSGGRRARRAARAPPAPRRALPAHQTPRGLPLRRQRPRSP